MEEAMRECSFRFTTQQDGEEEKKEKVEAQKEEEKEQAEDTPGKENGVVFVPMDSLTSTPAWEEKTPESTGRDYGPHRNRALVRCIHHIWKLHFLVLIGVLFPIAFVLGVCFVNSHKVPSTKYVAVYIFFGNLVSGSIVFGVMAGLYSFSKMRFLVPIASVGVCIYIVVTIVVNVVIFQPFLAYAVIIIIFLVEMVYTCIRFKFEKIWIFWGHGPIYLAIIFIIVNDNSIIPAYIKATSFVFRSAISVVFYPVFFYVLIMFTQFCAEKLHSDTPYIFTMVAMAIKAFMGRVLNTQLHSYGNVVVASVLSLFVRLAIKFFVLYRHKILRTTSKVLGEELIDRNYLAPSVVIPELLNTEKALEMVAIAFSCISVVFFQLSRPTTDESVVARAFILLAIQYGIEIASECLLIYIEMRHKINTKFKLSDKFVKFFPYSCAIGAALLSTRVVGIYQVLNGDLAKYSDTHF